MPFALLFCVQGSLVLGVIIDLKLIQPVGTRLSCLILTTFVASCSIQKACSDGNELEPNLCPSGYSEPVELVVDENVARHGDNDTTVEFDCKVFVLHRFKLSVFSVRESSQ